MNETPTDIMGSWIFLCLLVLVIATPFRLCIAYLASLRHRSAILWSCLFYVLGPFAAAVVLLPPKPGTTPWPSPFRHALLCELLCLVVSVPVVMVGVVLLYQHG